MKQIKLTKSKKSNTVVIAGTSNLKKIKELAKNKNNGNTVNEITLIEAKLEDECLKHK